jgi:hypothetical protein
LGVHVAKGGLAEKMLDASSFKPPAAAWFSTPDWHNPHYDTSENIEAVLTPDTATVQAGRYFEHLQRYREYFPDDQLHVLVFDDLKEDPRQFARDLFAAVGIRPSFELSLLDRKYGDRKNRGGTIWSVLKEPIIRATRARDVAQRVIRWARRNGYTE